MASFEEQQDALEEFLEAADFSRTEEEEVALDMQIAGVYAKGRMEGRVSPPDMLHPSEIALQSKNR